MGLFQGFLLLIVLLYPCSFTVWKRAAWAFCKVAQSVYALNFIFLMIKSYRFGTAE